MTILEAFKEYAKKSFIVNNNISGHAVGKEAYVQGAYWSANECLKFIVEDGNSEIAKKKIEELIASMVQK